MKMWRTLDSSTHLTLRTLRLRSFFFSSSSSSSSSLTNTNISCSSFTTFTSIITHSHSHSHSHSFLPLALTNKTRHFRSNFGSFVLRCVSSLPTIDWNDTVSCSEVDAEATDGTLHQDTKPSIPVRAFFFSTSVDLKSLVEQNKPNFVPPSSRMTNYVVLKFGDIRDSRVPGTSFLSGSNGCYMVVFQYGSIVLFNVPEPEVDGYLKIVKEHASGLLPEMRKDGQSIALDYYGRQVDGMVAEFTDINREMEATGKFKMQRKKLFQLVGKANSNLADVILKLGLFERSDIAWKDAKYAQIWEYLRDEFELTQRFASLDFKLKFVEHNIRFLQEILQNRKSDFLEWLIIALIGAEILLSLYDIVQRSAMKL
ncbi:uncharacterized protein LOC113872330 isoform X2 [Abrus precatorius]|uniref:Uncharacterized protein LOC113872330 isoform X2 n=1 Tax=Abrus precatorius TaxID=3816 RepID=A0A8B8MAM7_ABRPR|nr:uncharacterized protein LOC113872330 isoform X2 [Abrus precatorius]